MSSPNVVLYISSVTGLGGAELSLIELARHLDHAKYKTLLLTEGKGPLEQRFRSSNIPVEFGQFPFFSRKRPWKYAIAIWDIVRLIRKRDVKLIHVNCDRAVPHAVIASKITGVPIICHIRDTSRAWFLPGYVFYLNIADRIVSNSHATARHCIKSGMKPKKIQVIYGGFEMHRFLHIPASRRDALRGKWGVSKDGIAIGLVGQILRHKGHEEFLRSAAIVHNQIPSTKFVIVGDDHLSHDKGFLAYLNTLAENLEIATYLTFTGFNEDIPLVMKSLDILAVPSWEEPFGRVVVEGLAAGCPVVASLSGGIPEIIDDGITGLLVPPKDPEALADAIIRLCVNLSLRQKLKENGLQRAMCFDIVEHVRQFERLYSSLTN